MSESDAENDVARARCDAAKPVTIRQVWGRGRKKGGSERVRASEGEWERARARSARLEETATCRRATSRAPLLERGVTPRNT